MRQLAGALVGAMLLACSSGSTTTSTGDGGAPPIDGASSEAQPDSPGTPTDGGNPAEGGADGGTPCGISVCGPGTTCCYPSCSICSGIGGHCGPPPGGC